MGFLLSSCKVWFETGSTVLHQDPLDLHTLLPDSLLRKAKEDSKFEYKGRCHTQSTGRRDSRYHSYRRSDKWIRSLVNSVQGDSLSDNNKCCKLSCYKSCTYCKRAATKERCKSGCCKTLVIKICE